MEYVTALHVILAASCERHYFRGGVCITVSLGIRSLYLGCVPSIFGILGRSWLHFGQINAMCTNSLPLKVQVEKQTDNSHNPLTHTPSLMKSAAFFVCYYCQLNTFL